MSFSNCKGVLKPICIPYAEFQPNEITCPQITTSEVTSPLCNFIPTIHSITDLFINLPFFLLFTVSLPARFLYCLAYSFLVNVDSFIKRFFYYFIYPAIDLLTSPFIYFVLGFNNGLADMFDLPNELYGFLNACFTNNVLETIYRGVGDIFYTLGFGIGFIVTLITRVFNFVIDLNCYLAYLTLDLGVSYCVNIGIHTFSGCNTISIQPFAFLQQFVCKFLNCGCALGQPPTIGLTIPIAINCNTPSCGGSSIVPPCMLENLENPLYTSEYSEVVITSTEYTYSVSDLSYCDQCINSSENCDLCNDVIQSLSQQGISYPCNQYNEVISRACYECSENGYTEACNVCNGIVDQCTLNVTNGSMLSSYSEYVFSCDQCYVGFKQYCSECNQLQNELKIENAYYYYPPPSPSESSETSETSESSEYYSSEPSETSDVPS